MNSMHEDIPPGMTRPSPPPVYRVRVPVAQRMTMLKAVRRCLRKFDVFSGRARRAEYWKFVLAFVIGQMLIVSIYHLIFGPRLVMNMQTLSMERTYDGGWPATIYSFLMFTPLLTAAWRRLHDTDKPGWIILIPAGLTVATLAAVYTIGNPVSLSGVAPWAIAALLAIAASHILIFIQLARRGTAGPNRFGPDPLEVTK